MKTILSNLFIKKNFLFLFLDEKKQKSRATEKKATKLLNKPKSANSPVKV